MARIVCLSFVLFFGTIPLWSQVEPSASGGSGSSDDESLTSLPGAVSGSFYPSEVGADVRENFLSGGLLFTAAYDDNLLAGFGSHPIAAESYWVLPNIGLETKTARTTAALNYTAGFMFYHPTSNLNDLTQNAVGDLQFRPTRHTFLGVQETFQQNSTVFSEPYLMAGSGISASPTYVAPQLVAPYVGQITDSTSIDYNYQFSRSSMVGATGYYSSFKFSSAAQIQGLYNSVSGGGSASYSRRLGRTQYLGLSYRYTTSNTTPGDATTDSQYALAHYSARLPNRFSLSLGGGPEYVTVTAPGAPTTHSWNPSGNASMGWQKDRANFVLTYSRSVTTGWGIYGAFTSDSASALMNWRFSPRLNGGLSSTYGNTSLASSKAITFLPLGHTIYVRATMVYRLAEHLNVAADYGRLHNSIAGLPLLSEAPNDDRFSISFNYVLQKSLGR